MSEDSDASKPTVRRLSDPKSMVGASSAEVMAVIPDGWYVVPFPDGRPGFQALDPGKLPGANGQIVAHLGRGGNPLLLVLTGEDNPALYALNSCWELHCFGSIVAGRSKQSDGSSLAELALHTADAAMLLFHSKLVRVWEMDLLTGDSKLLAPKKAEFELSILSNWRRDETDPAIPSTTVVFFLDFTPKGRRAMEQFRSKPSKPIDLKTRKQRVVRPFALSEKQPWRG